jgi:peptidoglycan hydrolase-like protein with peptidoglycan-binding domain
MDTRLTFGSRGPEVTDAQNLLNNFPSNLDPLDPDGSFGQLTGARVVEFKTDNGLFPNDAVIGPQTHTALYFPSADQVEGGQLTAKIWVDSAQRAVQLCQAFGLAGILAAATGTIPPPTDPDTQTALTALKTHFKIDLLDVNTFASNQFSFLLDRIEKNYHDIRTTLDKADVRNGVIFHSVGPATALADNNNDAAAAANAIAYTMPRDDFRFPKHGIFFTPAFNNFTLFARGAMVVHECTHFISRNHPDFAFEHPLFDGQVGSTGTQNYAQLDAEPASRNPSTYASFAQHVFFKADTRFGAGNNT